MKYGIICAMPEEINLLISDITAEKVVSVSGREFYEGKLYKKDVVVCLSRIGKVASASTATTMIDHFHADCIIFCGTAGGVDKTLNVGDVVIADKLIQHDFFTGVDYFRIPLIEKSYFETDKNLSEAMHQAVNHYVKDGIFYDVPKKHLDEFHIVKPKVAVGTIASGDQFICDSAKNEWLNKNIKNLKCVEMEGAAVAQVCYEFGVPLAVMRVISDSANDDAAIDFMHFIKEAACYFTKGSLKAFLEDAE